MATAAHLLEHVLTTPRLEELVIEIERVNREEGWGRGPRITQPYAPDAPARTGDMTGADNETLAALSSVLEALHAFKTLRIYPTFDKLFFWCSTDPRRSLIHLAREALEPPKFATLMNIPSRTKYCALICMHHWQKAVKGYVLSEILTYCDIYAVVSFLRRSLLRGLSARHHILNLHAIDDLTTEQLIAEVKRLVCGPATWSDKSSAPSTVSSSKAFPVNEQTRLLPGGRYFSVLRPAELHVYNAVTGIRVWLRSLAGTYGTSWEVEMRDDGQSAVFFFMHNNNATNRQVLSIVQADFSTGLWNVHLDGVLNTYIGRAYNPVLYGNLLGVEWVYRPWGKRERGMLVIDWRKQLYVIFDCTTVSSTQTQAVFVPGHIIFTTATVQQPHDRLILIYTLASIGSRWRPICQLLSSHHASVRDFEDLNLNARTLVAVMERVEHADIRLSRDVESRVFRPDPRMHMILHPNPIRDNTYKLMIYITDGHWGNKSGVADTFRQKLGRQPPGAKAVLFTYRLTVGSAPDYTLSWTRVSAVPAVPNINSSISYAGRFLTGWGGQGIRKVVVLPRGSAYVCLSSSAGAVISVKDQHVKISHYI
ncbi:hypothetical protein B0H13DRAFT_2503298 [Mycena leptocephala]|nr:hypothetical protein B0H13DRAFT_2503298 [Mycena leptocephala]